MKAQRHARIVGTGRYLPPRVVPNCALESICQTSDQWIRERTGIETRHYVLPGQTSSELGTYAAEKALEAAQLSGQAIDALIFATLSPDLCFPGSGVLVQNALGMEGKPAFDIRNQCSGFLYGLQLSKALIESGTYDRILVIGAEVHSTGLDFSPEGRDVSVLFGDGAGAVVLEASDAPGLIDIRLGAEGRFASLLYCDGPASGHYPRRIQPRALQLRAQYPRMNGREIFKRAVKQMKESVEALLSDHGKEISSIDLMIAHQANLRINEMVRRGLKLERNKMYNNIERYGNTTAASIPIALDEVVREGRLQRGDWVVFAAFGAGLTWGSALMRW